MKKKTESNPTMNCTLFDTFDNVVGPNEDELQVDSQEEDQSITSVSSFSTK